MFRRKTDKADSIKCPTCNAAVGDRCKMSTGKLRNTSHKNRRILAESKEGLTTYAVERASKVLSVRCPTCKVDIGVLCKLSSGKLRSTSHRNRRIIVPIKKELAEHDLLP